MIVLYLNYVLIFILSICHWLALGRVLRPGPAISVWLAIAYGYWCAATFLVVQVGIGRALLGSVRKGPGRPGQAETILLAFAIGSYLSYAVLLAEAIVGLDRVSALVAYLVFALGLGVPGLWRVARDLKAGGASPGGEPTREAVRPDFGEAVLLLSAALLAVPYVAQTILPVSDWDGVMYHLPLARRFLERGVWETDPYVQHYDFPGAIQLFYGLFLWAGAESAIVPFQFLVSIATVVAARTFCGRFWGEPAARWVVLIGLSTSLIWGTGASSRVDVILALYFILACFALFLWYEDPRREGYLAVTGMALGMTLGIKYTAVFLAAPTIVAFGVLAWRVARRSGHRPAVLAAWLVIFLLVPSSFWYLRNWQGLGDPLYPMLGNRLVYLDGRGQSRGFLDDMTTFLDRTLPDPAELHETLRRSAFRRLARPIREPVTPTHQLNLWDLFVYPNRYSRNEHHGLSPLILLGFALPLARRDLKSLVLWSLGVLSFVPIAANGSMSRYLIPPLMILAVGAAVSLHGCLEALGRRSARAARVGSALVVLLTGSLILYDTFLQWSRFVEIDPVAYLAGREPPAEYLKRVGHNRVRNAPIMCDLINPRLPPSGQYSESVFMIGETKGYYLKCPYIPDHMTYEGHRWLAELMNAGGDYATLRDRLRSLGVRYLVVDAGHLDWTLSNRPLGGGRLRMILGAAYHGARFLEHHAQFIYSDPRTGYYVAELR